MGDFSGGPVVKVTGKKVWWDWYWWWPWCSKPFTVSLVQSSSPLAHWVPSEHPWLCQHPPFSLIWSQGLSSLLIRLPPTLHTPTLWEAFLTGAQWTLAPAPSQNPKCRHAPEPSCDTTPPAASKPQALLPRALVERWCHRGTQMLGGLGQVTSWVRGVSNQVSNLNKLPF